MGLFSGDKKVKAAAGSMHPFCSEMRGLFPGATDDRTVEASLVFLYRRLCHETFGHRFVEKWDAHIRDKYKHATVPEINAHVLKLARMTEQLEGQADPLLDEGVIVTDYEHCVRCMIRAIFTCAECGGDDSEVIHSAFAPVEKLMQKMAVHLRGIKKQNAFVMR